MPWLKKGATHAQLGLLEKVVQAKGLLSDGCYLINSPGVWTENERFVLCYPGLFDLKLECH